MCSLYSLTIVLPIEKYYFSDCGQKQLEKHNFSVTQLSNWRSVDAVLDKLWKISVSLEFNKTPLTNLNPTVLYNSMKITYCPLGQLKGNDLEKVCVCVCVWGGGGGGLTGRMPIRTMPIMNFLHNSPFTLPAAIPRLDVLLGGGTIPRSPHFI